MDKFETLLDLGHVRPDTQRGVRTGVPEVVFSEGKSVEQTLAAIDGILAVSSSAVVTRLSLEMFGVLQGRYGPQLESSAGRRTAAIHAKDRVKETCRGAIGVITGGSSDIEVAEEARMVCEASGVRVRVAYDVGVAGIHRLVEPLRDICGDSECGAIIVAAGMDGALPSVVAGLVDLPVIGIPTSTGYGYGGKGTGALMAMLQSCAPGLSVVNIDNGVGAAAVALKILRAISGGGRS